MSNRCTRRTMLMILVGNTVSCHLLSAFCDIAEIQQYFQPPSRIFIMPEMLQMKYHSVDDITVFNSVQSWGDVYKTQVSFNIHFIVYNLALIAELRVVCGIQFTMRNVDHRIIYLISASFS